MTRVNVDIDDDLHSDVHRAKRLQDVNLREFVAEALDEHADEVLGEWGVEREYTPETTDGDNN